MNLSLKLVECRFFLFNDPIRSILPENFKLQVYEFRKKHIKLQKSHKLAPFSQYRDLYFRVICSGKTSLKRIRVHLSLHPRPFY